VAVVLIFSMSRLMNFFLNVITQYCASDWQVSTVKMEQLNWNAIILWVEKDCYKRAIYMKSACA
jgi:hypothetical protein